MKGGKAPLIIADDTREMSGSDQVGRTQRQTMALCDVRYRIWAHIQPRPGFEKQIKALEEQAWRRIRKWKCFPTFFGCREFVAFLSPQLI